MFEKVGPLFAPPSLEGREKSRVAALLNTVLWMTIALMLLATPIFIFLNETRQDMWMSLAVVGGFIIAGIALVGVLHRGYVYIAGTLFTVLIWITATVGIVIFGGVRSSITPGYLLTIALAAALLGKWGVLAFGGASLIALVGVYFAETQWDAIVSPPRAVVAIDNLVMVGIIVSVMTAIMLAFAENVRHRMGEAQQEKAALREELEALEGSRESLRAQAVQLEQRTVQLQTAAEVAREMTMLHSLEELLTDTIQLIVERFNLYHAGLFLIDDVGEYAVLRTAAGQAAESLLQQSPRIEVGGAGTVGYVTGTGRAYRVEDVEQDQRFMDNELLQDTRSELMLPLRVGGEIIGALSVQSDKVQAFDEDDQSVLQAVADQLAVAIENVRLLDEMRETVAQLEATAGRFTRETWQAMAERRSAPGYRYRRMGVEPIGEQTPEMKQALARGEVVLQSDPKGENESILAVPMRMRNQVIGVLNLRFEGIRPSRDTLELVENLAERLALALENARLYEETQRRAAREQAVGQITGRVRAALNVEEILERAIEELGRTMGAVDGWIQLEESAADLSPTGN
jgi:GAF domain-containing protein